MKHLSQGGDGPVVTCASRPQCPVFRREGDGTETPEPFAAEAKFFTESRLLQRDVQIILESCPNQIILGTILHPVQPEFRQQQHVLLRCWLTFFAGGGVVSVSERQHHGAAAEGRLRPLCGLVHGGVHAGRRETARCRAVSERNFQHLSVHFSLLNDSVSCLEMLEFSHLSFSIQRWILFFARSAKERKVRIWKDYVAPTANLDQKDRQFVAKVSSRWTVPSLEQAHLLV